jgi:hypothetical protein
MGLLGSARRRSVNEKRGVSADSLDSLAIADPPIYVMIEDRLLVQKGRSETNRNAANQSDS